jgi:hypothetical protein
MPLPVPAPDDAEVEAYLETPSRPPRAIDGPAGRDQSLGPVIVSILAASSPSSSRDASGS